MVDRMLKLVEGAGSPEIGACWMSAIAYYEGNASWTDHPACVCPIIRTLAIGLNDACDDEQRQKLIEPHLFAPMGTRQPEHEQARVDLLVPFAMEMALYAAATANSATYDAYAAAAATANSATYDAYAAAAAAATANYDAYAAAYDAYAAAYDAYANDILERWRDFILELCAIGAEDREDIEQVRDLADLPHVEVTP